MDKIEAIQIEYSERLLAEIDAIANPVERFAKCRDAIGRDSQIDALIGHVRRDAVRELLTHMTVREVAAELGITTARVGQLAN
jgi:hypothetical protein